MGATQNVLGSLIRKRRCKAWETSITHRLEMGATQNVLGSSVVNIILWFHTCNQVSFNTMEMVVMKRMGCPPIKLVSLFHNYS